jgi:hypothetical protein
LFIPVLDENRLEHVRDVLAGVDRFLELLVDVLPPHELDRVDTAAEETRDRLTGDPVSLVLELAQLDQLAAGVLEALQHDDRFAKLARGTVDHARLLGRLAPDLTHAVAGDLLGGVVDEVADVVERRREPVHVVAVERRHERAVEQVEDLVRQAVAFVLELLDVAHARIGLRRESLEQLDQCLRDRHRILRGAVVQREELALLRNEAHACHAARCLPRSRRRRLTSRSGRSAPIPLVHRRDPSRRAVSPSDTVGTVTGQWR